MTDNVDYANKSWYLNGELSKIALCWDIDIKETGPYTTIKRDNYPIGAGSSGIFFRSTYFDSNRQTLTQGLNFSQETRPKTKFFSLLIYAGYPIA